MSKRKLMTIVAGAIMLAAGAASAGYRYLPAGVRLGHSTADGSGFAGGVISLVRTTSDSNQYIYCYTYGTFGGCAAVNLTNDVVACTTQDPGMLAVMRSTNGDSYVFFSADTAGACTNVSVQNGSQYAPKGN
jgi:hypothetical protein